jgi:hypothetical protein
LAVLVDGHCHRVLAADPDRAGFELACTEADLPPPSGVSYLDSQLGFAVRRWCAPALGLPAHTGIEDYLARRATLGWSAATVALLRAAELAVLLLDTGLGDADLLDPATLEILTGVPVREVVRLERLAERLAGRTDAAGFAEAYAQTLAGATAGAVAVKSVIAYRHGLAIPPDRPTAAQVRRAAGDWLRTSGRLTDPVLLRQVLWAGVDTGLPLQLHTGFGDRDLTLRSADPTLAQPFLAATMPLGTPVILLHCYPYHRQAGWLAQVYPHVYVDVGLTIGHLGARAAPVLAEFFELAPFGKLLFSTDAYLLPELYLVGAAQFRHSLRQTLDGWLADGAIAAADAERVTELVCAGNARRVYRTLPT